MKILAMNYQRNGICGEPFMVAVIQNIDGFKGTFFSTFETDNSDKEINIHTCRVVKMDAPYENWRGDNVAHDIQKAFMATGLKTYYDWLTQFREAAKGTQYYKVPSKRTKAVTA